MQVTFIKGPGRYFMTVEREQGVELAPRQGPGYHEHLPHDAVRFLLEREAKLKGGVFGRLARGENHGFTPADPRHLYEEQAEEPRHSIDDKKDMIRSERLTPACQALWEQHAGLREELPDWLWPEETRLPEDFKRHLFARLDAFAGRWHSLASGGTITLSWNSAPTPRKRTVRRTP